MRKTACSLLSLFHPDSVCFLASGHLITLCSSYSTLFFFFSVSFDACVFSLLHKKRGRTSDFSHQVYLIEQLHISLSCHCVRIKAATQSFLLADNIKAICFVWRNVRVNRRGRTEIGKRSHNRDVSERHERQAGRGSRGGSVWVKKEKLEVKER